MTPLNIAVTVKLVPDLVEELEITESGTALDTTWLRLIINEEDDHALEQAILLKERVGGRLTVLAPEMEGIDDVLYAAAAKGADRLIKLSGDFEGTLNNHALARALSNAITELQPDLVLTGVQAHDDMDGSVGPLMAAYLNLPYVGYVSGISVDNGKAVVRKEYPGGLIAEMAVQTPAVIGIQAAEQPPRYIAVSKVRQAMNSATIEDQGVASVEKSGGLPVDRMYQPKPAARATMLEGDEEEIAQKLIEIFREVGVM